MYLYSTKPAHGNQLLFEKRRKIYIFFSIFYIKNTAPAEVAKAAKIPSSYKRLLFLFCRKNQSLYLGRTILYRYIPRRIAILILHGQALSTLFGIEQYLEQFLFVRSGGNMQERPSFKYHRCTMLQQKQNLLTYHFFAVVNSPAKLPGQKNVLGLFANTAGSAPYSTKSFTASISSPPKLLAQ